MTVVVIVFIVLAALLAAATLGFTSADIILEVQEKKAAQKASAAASSAVAAPLAVPAAADDAVQGDPAPDGVPLPDAQAAPAEAPAEAPVSATLTEPTEAPVPVAEAEPTEGPEAVGQIPFFDLPVLESTDAETADALLTDSEASSLLRYERGAGKGALAAVNLDTVNTAFAAGETVTIKALKARGLVPQKAGRVKILARGTLNKPLTVKAEAFSAAALKMIGVTGGSAILLKR